MKPKDLRKNNLWWMGPRWLSEEEDLRRGQLEVAVPEQDLENEFMLIICIAFENSVFIRLTQRISTGNKLQRSVVLIFIKFKMYGRSTMEQQNKWERKLSL